MESAVEADHHWVVVLSRATAFSAEPTQVWKGDRTAQTCTNAVSSSRSTLPGAFSVQKVAVQAGRHGFTHNCVRIFAKFLTGKPPWICLLWFNWRKLSIIGQNCQFNAGILRFYYFWRIFWSFLINFGHFSNLQYDPQKTYAWKYLKNGIWVPRREPINHKVL